MDWHVLLGQNLAFQKLKKNSNLVNAKDIWGNCIIHALVDLRKKKKENPEYFALTLTANAMMNLDEFLTK